MITMKDIAEEADVSTTTVSRVINNKPDVSEETKQNVLKIIEKLGYNPNEIARGLALKKTHTLGIVIPDISNPFFPEVVKGIEIQSKKEGYSVLFYNTHSDIEEEKNAINILRSKQVDGLIVSLSINNQKKLKKLEEENFPLVQIDRDIPSSIYPKVSIDNISSAYRATEYLIKKGHSKIAHFTGNLNTETGKERKEGFIKAVNEYNLNVDEDWILEGKYKKESGYKLTKKLLKYKEKPTAIFAANDLIAVGCYEALFEKGFNIPQDFSLIGHDDIYISSLIKPNLTTMSQPKLKLGQKAAKLLIDQIESSINISKQEDFIFETDIIKRQSVRELI